MMESEHICRRSVPVPIFRTTPSDCRSKAVTGLRGVHCALADAAIMTKMEPRKSMRRAFIEELSIGSVAGVHFQWSQRIVKPRIDRDLVSYRANRVLKL